MRQPTIKDKAEYFRRILEVGLCREQDIEAWADKMIVENKDTIPNWLLNLSTDGEASKTRLLNAIPGEFDALTVWNLVLSSLGMATRLGNLSRDQVVRVLFRWAVGSELPDQFKEEAYKLDDGLDGIKAGWFSESQFIEDFEKFFEQFRSTEPSLPQMNLKTRNDPPRNP
jgi:hypothetical protein